MSVTLSEGQVTALGRFNRSYAVKALTLTEHPGTNDWVLVNAILKAGGDKTIERRFVLDIEGKLVKENAEILG